MGISSTQAAAAAQLLAFEKIIPASDQERVSRILKNFLGADYIPTKSVGCAGSLKDLRNVRKCVPGLRCAQIVGHDDQSGPFYCGDPAIMMAESIKYDGAYTVVCSRHVHHIGIKSMTHLEQLDVETRAAEALTTEG